MHKTQLHDRVLWGDGDSTIPAVDMERMLIAGKSTCGLFVDELTQNIVQFNKYVPTKKQIKCKKSSDSFDYTWKIPSEYFDIDLHGFVLSKLLKTNDSMSSADKRNRMDRISYELDVFEKKGLRVMLCAIIYIINTLEKNNIVWGVGRGSSVSSFVLYVLGIHDVDSVQYGLDFSDFIRD